MIELLNTDCMDAWLTLPDASLDLLGGDCRSSIREATNGNGNEIAATAQAEEQHGVALHGRRLCEEDWDRLDRHRRNL